MFFSDLKHGCCVERRPHDDVPTESITTRRGAVHALLRRPRSARTEAVKRHIRMVKFKLNVDSRETWPRNEHLVEVS